MEVIPAKVAFATAALTGFNRNRYRVETNGATSAGPSSIVTITMPSNALLDLKTFRVHMNLTTTKNEATDGTPANGDVYAKLPADVSSLIQSCEPFVARNRLRCVPVIAWQIYFARVACHISLLIQGPL